MGQDGADSEEGILQVVLPLDDVIDDLIKVWFPWAFIKSGVCVLGVTIPRGQVALWHSEVPEHASLRVERGLVPVLSRQLHPMVPV